MGDGNFRFRNGLLSEKLGTDELPLQDYLMTAGRRAVTEEEMARIVIMYSLLLPLVMSLKEKIEVLLSIV